MHDREGAAMRQKRLPLKAPAERQPVPEAAASLEGRPAQVRQADEADQQEVRKREGIAHEDARPLAGRGAEHLPEVEHGREVAECDRCADRKQHEQHDGRGCR